MLSLFHSMLVFKHWIRNFYFLRLDFSVLTNSVAIIIFLFMLQSSIPAIRQQMAIEPSAKKLQAM